MLIRKKINLLQDDFKKKFTKRSRNVDTEKTSLQKKINEIQQKLARRKPEVEKVLEQLVGH